MPLLLSVYIAEGIQVCAGVHIKVRPLRVGCAVQAEVISGLLA